MFTGTYICKLDKKGRFRIPKRHMEILAKNADEKGILFFADGGNLRVYTQRSAREYIDNLKNLSEPYSQEYAMLLIRSLLSNGMAFCTRFGIVTIPESFRSRYQLAPGMRLLLRGNLDYFEILEQKQEDV